MPIFRRARLPVSLAILTGLILTIGAPAQTWIAPTGSGYGDWRVGANWSPGTVPDSPTAVAVFLTPSVDASLSTALITGPTVTLQNLWLHDNTAPGTSFGSPRILIGDTRTTSVATGSLLISGGGIYPGGDSTGVLGLQMANGSLEFAQQASARTNIVMARNGSVEGTRRLIFSGQSSLRGNVLAAGRGHNGIEFRDQAVLYSGTLNLEQSATVLFRDNATVVDGRIVTTEAFSLNARIIVLGSPDLSGLDLVGNASPGTRLDLSGATGPVLLRSISGYVDIDLGGNQLLLTQLPQATNFTLGGVISGTGGLVLASYSTASILVTQPNNSYTGPTSISGTGLLVHLVDGGRLNNVRVLAPATLRVQGSGTIGGDLVLRGGTLRLANLTQAGLTVQGTAILGGTLTVDTAPSAGQVGTQRYPFLTATAIDGRFVSTANLPNTAMLKSRIDYGIKDVAVVVEQQSFATLEGTTAATRDFGAYLDANTAAPSATLRPLLAGLNQLGSPAAVIDSLAGLAPDRYAVLPALGFAAATARHASLAAALADDRGAPPGASAFFAAGTRRARYDGLDDSPTAQDKTDTGLAGVRWRHGTGTLGFFAATDRSRTDLDHAGSRADAQETAAGAFGELRVGTRFGRVTLSTGRTTHDLSRRVTGAVNETATARPASRRTDASLEAGGGLAVRDCRVTPMIGLLWSEWQMGGFTEAGAPLSALAVSGWSQRSLRGRLGFEAAPRTPGRLIPRLALHWLHEFAGAAGFTTRLASDPGAGYRADGRPVDRNLFAGSLTLEAALGTRGLGWLRLGGARGDHSRTTSDFSAGLQWRF